MSQDDHYLKAELYDLVQEDSAIFEFLQSGSLDGIWVLGTWRIRPSSG